MRFSTTNCDITEMQYLFQTTAQIWIGITTWRLSGPTAAPRPEDRCIRELNDSLQRIDLPGTEDVLTILEFTAPLHETLKVRNAFSVNPKRPSFLDLPDGER